MDTFIQGLGADVNIVLTLIVLFKYKYGLKDSIMHICCVMTYLLLRNYYVIIFN